MEDCEKLKVSSGQLRLRLGSAPSDQMPRASHMSVLEQSIRKFAKEPTKSVVKAELDFNFLLVG